MEECSRRCNTSGVWSNWLRKWLHPKLVKEVWESLEQVPPREGCQIVCEISSNFRKQRVWRTNPCPGRENVWKQSSHFWKKGRVPPVKVVKKCGKGSSNFRKKRVCPSPYLEKVRQLPEKKKGPPRKGRPKVRKKFVKFPEKRVWNGSLPVKVVKKSGKSSSNFRKKKVPPRKGRQKARKNFVKFPEKRVWNGSLPVKVVKKSGKSSSNFRKKRSLPVTVVKKSGKTLSNSRKKRVWNRSLPVRSSKTAKKVWPHP